MSPPRASLSSSKQQNTAFFVVQYVTQCIRPAGAASEVNRYTLYYVLAEVLQFTSLYDKWTFVITSAHGSRDELRFCFNSAVASLVGHFSLS